MKKDTYTRSQNSQILSDEDFQSTILGIINDVIEKKKIIHLKYDQLTKKLWLSDRQLLNKTMLAKYILARLLRESDRAFAEAQLLARQVCPKCKKNFSNYEHYSIKLH